MIKFRTGTALKALLLLLLIGACPGWAGFEEQVGTTRMDWQSRQITATWQESGTVDFQNGGRLSLGMRKRQARLQVRKILWEGLLQVRVEGEQSVADVVHDRPQSWRALRALVNSSPVEFMPWQHTSTQGTKKRLECRARLLLTGRVASICIPASIWYASPELAVSAVNATLERTSRPWTGLVVDARALEGKPALLCRLYDRQGRLVYGPSMLSREVGLTRGMAVYASTYEEALATTRAGNAPLQVRAVSTHGNSPTEFVLQQEDLLDFWVAEGLQVLRQAKVVILLHQEEEANVREYSLEE